MIVRPVNWELDAPAMASIPTGWRAESIIDVERGPMSFALRERPLEEPYDKDGQPLSARFDSLKEAHEVFLAERDGEVLGVAGLYLSEWNFRPSLGNLQVAPEHRRTGVGRALVTDVIAAARALQARGLWLEVTNVNVAAVALYRSLGFRLCGLDEAMYMRWGLDGETALFFLLEF